jgi:hypothetical protein
MRQEERESSLHQEDSICKPKRTYYDWVCSEAGLLSRILEPAVAMSARPSILRRSSPIGNTEYDLILFSLSVLVHLVLQEWLDILDISKRFPEHFHRRFR